MHQDNLALGYREIPFFQMAGSVIKQIILHRLAPVLHATGPNLCSVQLFSRLSKVLGASRAARGPTSTQPAQAPISRPTRCNAGRAKHSRVKQGNVEQSRVAGRERGATGSRQRRASGGRALGRASGREARAKQSRAALRWIRWRGSPI